MSLTGMETVKKHFSLEFATDKTQGLPLAQSHSRAPRLPPRRLLPPLPHRDSLKGRRGAESLSSPRPLAFTPDSSLPEYLRLQLSGFNKYRSGPGLAGFTWGVGVRAGRGKTRGSRTSRSAGAKVGTPWVLVPIRPAILDP